MKHVICLVLLFHFMDCVIVKSGFYKDCYGEVKDYNKVDKTYLLSSMCNGDNFDAYFKESELKACKK